jgi:hypothetical protein
MVLAAMAGEFLTPDKNLAFWVRIVEYLRFQKKNWMEETMSSKIVTSLLALGLAVAMPVMADSINVYTVGSTGTALDPVGNPVSGMSVITWTNTVATAGPATLSIIAEGIDSPGPGAGEVDAVLFNGVFVGDLTQQGFYSPASNLCIATAITGPCALSGTTALTTSTFSVNALAGANTVTVDVDPSNWVDQIDVGTLTSTAPEPSSISLLGLGIGLTLLAKKRMISHDSGGEFRTPDGD